MSAGKIKRVAIGGFGAIGRIVAKSLDEGLPNLALSAVSGRNVERIQRDLDTNFRKPAPVLPLSELAAEADIVVECAPAELLKEVGEPVLKAGKTLIVVSVGAILDFPHLVELAADNGARILVPSGAILGLDALQAAAVGSITSVRMVTRKPVKGLVGAPYLEKTGISISDIQEPVKLFEGAAIDAIHGFPANLNVAIAVSLAGIGPDRTKLEVWADPSVKYNTHTIEVISDSANLTMKIENTPSEENPKTGRITPLSIISTLKKLTAPMVIGA